MTLARPTFDPADPGFRIDPYPIFARLRADNPVHWADAVRGFVVTRYADVQRVIALLGQLLIVLVAANALEGVGRREVSPQ